MKNRFLRHLLFWVFYLLFETYLEYAWISDPYAETGASERLLMAFSSEMAQLLAVKIPLVYLLFFMLAKTTTLKNVRPFFFPAFFLFLVALFALLNRVLLTQFLLPYVYHDTNPAPLFHFHRFINAFLDLIFVASLAIAIQQYNQSQHLKAQEKQLIKEKLETELNFLKSQLNPHFLFNTLNNIYALARKKSDETASVVVKLSKLLRFMLYEAQSREISLGREIQFLKDYLELEKIRYGKHLQLSFVQTVDDENIGITPLILIPLVENAFKHGASESTVDAYIRIELHTNKAQLSFLVENSVEEDALVVVEGIGLKNLRRQLKLVYPEHSLSVSRGTGTFIAKLHIALDQQHAY